MGKFWSMGRRPRRGATSAIRRLTPEDTPSSHGPRRLLRAWRTDPLGLILDLVFLLSLTCLAAGLLLVLARG